MSNFTGKHHSEETKRRISEKLKAKGIKPPIQWGNKNSLGKKRVDIVGEKHPKWKGDNVGYRGLHIWVARQYWKAKECVYCGARDRRIEWASISHKAKRDLDDYIPLCVTCHRLYDSKKARKEGYYHY